MNCAGEFFLRLRENADLQFRPRQPCEGDNFTVAVCDLEAGHRHDQGSFIHGDHNFPCTSVVTLKPATCGQFKTGHFA